MVAFPSSSSSPQSSASGFRAVFFDFGGVVLTSPFEAFERYERDHGLPVGLIRTINSTSPDANAWARMERGEVDVHGFVSLFEAEAESLGHRLDGYAVIGMLAGRVRPAMVEAIARINDAGLITACLTNNFNDPDRSGERHGGRSPVEADEVRTVQAMFDHMVESSVVGVRKPEPEFYRKALVMARVEPEATVFLDDLGINLKPARAMGMTTIKVVDPMVALRELEDLLGLPLVD